MAVPPGLGAVQSVTMTSDAELLRAHLGGDQDAFAILVGRHLGLVRAACARQLGASAAVDDAVQAVFLVLARKAEAMCRADAPLAPWLHTVAHHVARNQARIEARHARGRAQGLPPELVAPIAADPWGEVRAHLDAALEALPAPYRRTLVLHYLDGLDRAAVGAALGLSLEAVKKRIGRGLELLRGRLARGGERAGANDLVASLAVVQVGSSAPPAALAATVAHAALGHSPPAVATLASGASSSMIKSAALAAVAHVASLTTPVAVIATIACGLAAERSARAEAGDTGAPPAQSIALSHRFAPGTSFYYATLLRWTFTLDDPRAQDFLKDSVTISPLAELDIIRVEAGEDAQHRPTVRLTHALTWGSAGPRAQDDASGKAIGLSCDLPNGRKFLSRQVPNGAPCLPGTGDTEAAIVDGAPAPQATIDPRTQFGPALTRLGINDLLWPLPARLAPRVPAATPERTVTWCAGDAGNPVLHYACISHASWPALFQQQFQLGTASIAATLGVSVAGTGEATVVEDAAAGLPASAQSRWNAHVTITPDIPGMAISVTGVFNIERTAWRLPIASAQEEAPDALVRALAPRRALIEEWSRSTEATLGAVGRGALDSLEHPPHMLEPTVPGGAPAAAPKPAHEF